MACLIALTLCATAHASEPQMGKCYDGVMFDYHLVRQPTRGTYYAVSPYLGVGMIKTKLHLENMGIGPVVIGLKKTGEKMVQGELGKVKVREWTDCRP